jgi:Fic-DOC domain mobile mystery protein B
LNRSYPDGATPLDPDEVAGLIPSIATRVDLNEFEERNILSARQWAITSRILRRDYPNVSAIRRLHQEMFNVTWTWAGQFRNTDKNIGTHWPLIPAELHSLCEDTRYWLDHGTYEWVELGARFHHRLVSIHPFPNGHGRHARLATDILLRQNAQRAFTWGSESLMGEGTPRRQYIEALRAADQGDLAPLSAFVKM